MGLARCFPLLLGFAALTTAYEITCPPDTIGGYCTCRYRYTPASIVAKVTCYNIDDVSILMSEIQKLRGHVIDSVLFLNLQVPYLPAGLFLGTTVREIIIQNSVLDNLYSTSDYSPSPFAGLEDTLQEISILSTKSPSKWYFPDMKGFKNFKKIYITDSPLNFVGHVFAEIGKGTLESITATYSSVYRIHPQAFPELLNLKEVNFKGNSIPYMVRTMFPDPAPLLKIIDLSENKLFTLPENMFDNMPALEMLDLSNNEFKTFQMMPAYNSLKYFYISNNPFECDCHLLPLEQLLRSDVVYNDLEFVKCSNHNSYKNNPFEYGCHLSPLKKLLESIIEYSL